MTLVLIFSSQLAGNQWAAPGGWDTLYPQLNLNLDDQTPYVLHNGATHVSTEVSESIDSKWVFIVSKIKNLKRLGGLLGGIVTVSGHKTLLDSSFDSRGTSFSVVIWFHVIVHTTLTASFFFYFNPCRSITLMCWTAAVKSTVFYKPLQT